MAASQLRHIHLDLQFEMREAVADDSGRFFPPGAEWCLQQMLPSRTETPRSTAPVAAASCCRAILSPAAWHQQHRADFCIARHERRAAASAGAPSSAPSRATPPGCRACRASHSLRPRTSRTGRTLRTVQISAPRSISACAKSPARFSGTSDLPKRQQLGLRAGSGSSTAKNRAITRSALASIAASRAPKAIAAIAPPYSPRPPAACAIPRQCRETVRPT
jgi:hypothetical protein